VKTEAIGQLLEIIEQEIGILDVCKNEPDDASIGWKDGTKFPMTFGHVRRARNELFNLRLANVRDTGQM